MFASAIPETSVVIRGVVRDAAEGTTIPYARIVAGTSGVGTITSTDGSFTLPVDSIPVEISIHHLTYNSSTVRIEETRSRVLIQLTPRIISIPEVTITGENPGTRIMRDVIERIARFKKSKSSFRYRSIQKKIIQFDTILSSVSASSSRIEGSSSGARRVFVDWSKSWLSFDSSISIMAGQAPLDFTSPRIYFWEETFAGVLSTKALEEFEFTLDSSRTLGKGTYFYISAERRLFAAPGLHAALIIAAADDRVVELTAYSNDAFGMSSSPAHIHSVRMTQSFSECEDPWLPVSIRTTEEVELFGPFMRVPIWFTEVISIDRKEFGIDTLSRRDEQNDSASSTYRGPFVDSLELERIPLTETERTMLVRLDTTNRVRVNHVQRMNSVGPVQPKLFDHVIAQFNRATGMLIGVSLPYPVRKTTLKILPTVMFSTAQARWYYDLGISGRPREDSRSTIVIGRHRAVRTDHDSDTMWIPGELADLAVGRRDRDPFGIDGWYFLYQYDLEPQRKDLNIRAQFGSAVEQTLSMQTTWSLLTPRFHPTPLLSIEEGRWQHASLEFRWVGGAATVSLWGKGLTRSEGRHLLGSLCYADSLLFLGTNPAAAPYVRFFCKVSGGTGRVPIQRWFSPSTGAWLFSAEGAFRGMQPKEFAGDQLATLVIEGNIRELPFFASGLRSIHRTGIELTFHGGAAAVGQKNVAGLAPPGTRMQTKGWYVEGGIGFSNIFHLLHVELTRRFTHNPRTVLTGRFNVELP